MHRTSPSLIKKTIKQTMNFGRTILILCIFVFVTYGSFVQLPEYTILRGRHYKRPYEIPSVPSNNKESQNRAAVIIVLPKAKFHTKLRRLYCSLVWLYKTIGMTSSMDTFLFIHSETFNQFPPWISLEFPHLQIIKIDPKSWVIPNYVDVNDDGDEDTIEQLIAGRWGLTYAHDFAFSQGYKYVLHLSEDTYIVEAPNVDIFQMMEIEGKALTFRDKTYIQPADESVGLLDLARFWMLSRNARYLPGSLGYNISLEAQLSRGILHWNRQVYNTNFLIVNLDFWFEAPIQDFLSLVLNTNSDVINKWGDRGVMNLIYLLFVQTEQVMFMHQNYVIQDSIALLRIFELLQCAVPVRSATTTTTSTSTVTVVGTDGNKEDENNTTQVSTTEQDVHSQGPDASDLHTVEVFMITQTSAPQPLRSTEQQQQNQQQVPREAFLLRWQFHPARCGRDTAEVNSYSQYSSEADDLLLRTNLWWFKYRVDEKFDRILMHGTEYSSLGRKSGDFDSAEECKQILRQQLIEYFDFYTAYGFDGLNMNAYYPNLLKRALDIFEEAFIH